MTDVPRGAQPPDMPGPGGSASVPAPPASGRGLLTMAMIAILALPVGVVVLYLIQELIHLVWFEFADSLQGPTLWAMVIGSTTLAGILVAAIRHHRNGHDPLSGLATVPVFITDYPAVMGAILVSLLGGLALGPEVALVTTGSLVGCEIARRRGDVAVSKGMMVGILFAIMALFVEPLLEGTFEVAANYTFTPIDIVGTVGIALLTAVVLMAGRWAAIGLTKVRGGDTPAVLPMAIFGLAVGLVAVAYHEVSDNPVSFVLTSGENNVKPLIALGTASAIGLAIAAKWLAYTFSLGGGFRGGPYFPALFIGAGVGGIAYDLFPSLSSGSAAAGIAAAFSYLMHGSWKATAILGLVIGFLVGGSQAILVCLLAVAVAKLLPAVVYHPAEPAADQSPAVTSAG